MVGQIVTTLIFGVLLTQTAEAGQAPLTRQSLPLYHALYEQLQGEFKAAYGVAEYYKLKGDVSPELTLVQASASLELGYLAHGRELINDLDEGSLLPENQSRLHLYLARDAYRRRDWLLLESHLSRLEPFQLDDRHYFFLLAESARVAGQFESSEGALKELEPDDVYQFYGRFNLASSLAVSNKTEAVRLLDSLITLPPRNLEQMLLTERARLALADLYLAASGQQTLKAQSEQYEKARRILSKVSADHQYGPMALARLARIDMQAERYENAAAIWDHLLQHYRWHHAATAAPSGLGYALLQSSGEEAAYGVYLAALKKIETQRNRLSGLNDSLTARLQNADWVLSRNVGEDSVVVWLAEGLGHDDWTSWLADDAVRQSAHRWQTLGLAYKDLLDAERDLSLFLQVDLEQQRRVQRSKIRIDEEALSKSSSDLVERLEADLIELTTRPIDFSDDLDQFATFEERQLLQSIASLSELNSEIHHKRIARLNGLVRFQIYEALPVRRQQLRHHLIAQLVDAQLLEQRIARINAKAEQLNLTDSGSGRITTLTAQTFALRKRTALALGAARDSLIAGVMDLIDRDQVLLTAQANGLQYDIARLLDGQFLAEAAP